MNNYYVTTSIPYVNARPHVGFALELAPGRRDRAVSPAHRPAHPVPDRHRRERLQKTSPPRRPSRCRSASSSTATPACSGPDRPRSHASPDEFIRTTEDRHLGPACMRSGRGCGQTTCT